MAATSNIHQNYQIQYDAMKKNQPAGSKEKAKLPSNIIQGLKSLGVKDISQNAIALLEGMNNNNEGIDDVWENIETKLTDGTFKLTEEGKLVVSDDVSVFSDPKTKGFGNLNDIKTKLDFKPTDFDDASDEIKKAFDQKQLNGIHWVDADNDGKVDDSEVSKEVDDKGNKIDLLYNDKLKDPTALKAALAAQGAENVRFDDKNNDGVIQAGELLVKIPAKDPNPEAEMTLECYNAIFDKNGGGLTDDEITNGWANIERGKDYGFKPENYFNSTKFKTINPSKIKKAIKAKASGKTLSAYIKDNFSISDSLTPSVKDITDANVVSTLVRWQSQINAMDNSDGYKALMDLLKEIIDQNSDVFNSELALPTKNDGTAVVPVDVSASGAIVTPSQQASTTTFDAAKVAGDILKESDIKATYEIEINKPGNTAKKSEIDTALIANLTKQIAEAETLAKLDDIATKIKALQGTKLDVATLISDNLKTKAFKLANINVKADGSFTTAPVVLGDVTIKGLKADNKLQVEQGKAKVTLTFDSGIEVSKDVAVETPVATRSIRAGSPPVPTKQSASTALTADQKKIQAAQKAMLAKWNNLIVTKKDVPITFDANGKTYSFIKGDDSYVMQGDNKVLFADGISGKMTTALQTVLDASSGDNAAAVKTKVVVDPSSPASIVSDAAAANGDEASKNNIYGVGDSTFSETQSETLQDA